jgi:hypothetical protein
MCWRRKILMHLSNAHGFQRVVGLGVGQPLAAGKEGGNAAEDDVLGHGLQPLLEQGLEIEAMRAAVPEEFGDLDLALGFRRLRRIEDGVVAAFAQFLRAGKGCKNEAGDADQGFQLVHV